MKIHMLGVGGSAMGNLAALLKELGHEVTGSDQELYPPMSEMLKDWGIEARPFHERNLEGMELCVIGNAVSRGNPEAEFVLNQGLPYISLPAAIERFLLPGKQVIVAAGTHGKTTTAFLMDHLLSRAEKPPGLFAGGIRADGRPGFRLSDSPYFVIEGDEYDSAFFDKSSKFLHYHPRYLILTSLDFDHADIFENRKEYARPFERLLRVIPGEGLVVANAKNKGVRDLLDGHEYSPIAWYDEEEKPFDFLKNPDEFPLLGRHNRQNAAAALTLGEKLGLPIRELHSALRSFPGVLRRLQTRARSREKSGQGPVIFIEDFAHHPAAVGETISAAREAYPGYLITALFEPRSASSHRDVFRAEYARALSRADEVYLCEVFDKNKVPKDKLLKTRELVKKLRELMKKRRGRAHYCANPEDALEKLKKNLRPGTAGRVVLAMSNGAFGGIYPRVEELVRGI